MSSADRKRTYVDPQVQGALVRRLIVHWFAFLAVAAAVSFCLQVLSNPLQPLGEHVRQIWWSHGPFLVVMLFLLPAFVLDTIKLSHRFAGPIYRLRNTIRKIAEGGPVEQLAFRDFDFWQGMAKDFNAMTARLTQDSQEESEQTEQPLETSLRR